MRPGWNTPARIRDLQIASKPGKRPSHSGVSFFGMHLLIPFTVTLLALSARELCFLHASQASLVTGYHIMTGCHPIPTIPIGTLSLRAADRQASLPPFAVRN